MISETVGSVYYSLMVMLPAALDRRLAKWSSAMPGTSWPAWGGHITLLHPFTVPAAAEAVDRLTDCITTVCRRHSAFQLRLDNPVAEQDYTRAGYFAVMLTARDREETGLDALGLLRRDLLAATDDLRTDKRPPAADDEYMPHVTLALGLGQPEAERMVNHIRTDGLTVRFFVEKIALVIFASTSDGQQVTQLPFTLAGVVNIFAD